MKNLTIFLIIILCPLLTEAQDSNENDIRLIDNFVRSRAITRQHQVNSDTLSIVFSGNFYLVGAGYDFGEGAGYGGEILFNVHDNQLVMTEEHHSYMELPVLLSLIKPEFRIKDENAARIFEASINKIYPVERGNESYVKHFRKENQWIFVRGKFFDNFQAIIATSDENGKISKMEFTLEYPGD